MVVIGSGIWYLRHPNAGGVPVWKQKMEALFAASSPSRSPIADEIVLMPVGNAVEARLSPERAITIHNEDILEMNDHLDLLLRTNFVVERPTLAIPRVFNQLIEGLDNETQDGLHFSDAISKAQASILLNLRCNDVLPKKFPFDKTCCSQYPTPNWIQILLLLVLLGWAPVGMFYHSRSESNHLHVISLYLIFSTRYTQRILPLPFYPSSQIKNTFFPSLFSDVRYRSSSSPTVHPCSSKKTSNIVLSTSLFFPLPR